jgi:histone H3/H4
VNQPQLERISFLRSKNMQEIIIQIKEKLVACVKERKRKTITKEAREKI